MGRAQTTIFEFGPGSDSDFQARDGHTDGVTAIFELGPGSDDF